jgi:hypothetical protein
MHAGRGGQVPGDNERWNDVMHNERHDDQLSRDDIVCSWDVHVLGWASLVHNLP